MSLKILHITSSHKGGAGIAALRLHKALQNEGKNSAFLAKGLSIDFKNEIFDDQFFKYKKPTLLAKLKKKLSFDENHRTIKKFNIVKAKLDCEIVTIPISLLKVHEHPLVKEADIIHLHWVGSLIDYLTFFSETSKPIVWTLHDANPFMGVFHYPIDAYKNLNIQSWEERMLLLKKTALSKIKNGACVSPSKWLLEEVLKTNMFSNFKTQKVISNSINLEQFAISYSKKNAREKLNISIDKKVILFISDSLEVERKGFDLLRKALEEIKDSFTLLTVGRGDVIIKNDKIKVKSLGFLDGSENIAQAYYAADVLVLPSLEDNLPNTMLESFSCGTPIISFKVGGMKEHVIENINGVLADEISSNSLKNSILRFLINQHQR